MKSGNKSVHASHSVGKAQLWSNLPPYGWKTVFWIIVVFVFLSISGRHSEIDKLIALTGEAGGYLIGVREDSQVVEGSGRILTSMFPPQISEITEISRIENFDEKNLPFLSRIETERVSVTELSPKTLELIQSDTTRRVLYNPIGYLVHVFKKMLETIEMAIWATMFAIFLSIPLAYLSSANYSPNRVVYSTARAVVSFLRALPELISAMFLVLAFGFGPIAGILALAFHAAGFLGKFYAEDIESADVGPQKALKAIGLSKIKILRFAVLPNVLPQYVAYNMYILDRNVRMATVVGIVGAGGIGQELKGRYDMFDYGHVTTILLVIFITVFALDQLSSWIRAKII